MATSLLARFTPSLMQPDMLEAMFVQREDLANRIVDQIRDSVLTSAKNHNLLIGPRGIGKSHLVSLIHHRIAGMDDLHGRALIAWLREEEWGVTSFLDLLLRILRALNEKYPDLIPAERLIAIQRTSRRIAEQECEKLLRDLLANKVLVLILENLDDMFNGLGPEGQRKLRAYLQDNQNCTILATAQSLFKGVSLHNSPFYGFFRIQHLAPLEFDDAVRLISNIARWLQDSELAAFIKTPVGRARLRAVHHLAGGNHRVYVIFTEFLTRESLDELVSPFLRMLDDLTPYYQARMAWLSPHQRKIVEHLCEQRGALPVKAIAQGCFISAQSASSQLKILRDMGYVESTTNKRESFYELREPLMRLCIELKKNRGGPIRLLVDFLRLWHSRSDLQNKIDALSTSHLLEREYINQAIHQFDEEAGDLRIEACLKDLTSYTTKGDYQRALDVAEELVAIRGDWSDLHKQGSLLLNLDRHDEALASADKLINLDPNNIGGWRLRALTLGKSGRYDEALAALAKLIELDPLNVRGWQLRSLALESLGRYDETLAALDRLIELDPVNVLGWLRRGRTLDRLNREEEALAALDKVVELDSKNIEAWGRRGWIQGALGRYEEALASADKIIGLDTKNPRGWHIRGLALQSLKRHEDALLAIDKLIELDPKNIAGWWLRALSLGELRRFEEMFGAAEKMIEIDPKNMVGWGLRTGKLAISGRHEEALSTVDTMIDLNAKIPAAWLLRGLLLDNLGRYEEALVAANKMIEIDPKNIDACRLRGTTLESLGRYEEALVELSRQEQLAAKDVRTCLMRSQTLISLGRYEEALTAFGEAVDLGLEPVKIFDNITMVLLMLNRWEEAISKLEEGLSQLSSTPPVINYDALEIVRGLLESGRDAGVLRERVSKVMELHVKYGRAASLGTALVKSIDTLIASAITPAIRKAWLEIWELLLREQLEFQIPLRLLKAAVEYTHSKDESVLLELPIEERNVLKSLLGRKASMTVGTNPIA